MKKSIISGLFIVCSFLKASENPNPFQLELPAYDPVTKMLYLLPINLNKRDTFTKCIFKELMEESCKQNAFGYQMTVFKCLGLSGLPEFAIADTKAFNRWIYANGKVDPVTRKLIISNSRQDFIINPTNDGRFEIFRIPCQPTPAVLHAGEKRKREEDSLSNDAIEKAFREIAAERALRRAKEQAFLRDND